MFNKFIGSIWPKVSIIHQAIRTLKFKKGNLCSKKFIGSILTYSAIKAALSVTFDLFVLEIMFLFFKNTVKILKFRYTFYPFRNN